ncbi:hypothetical protein BU24DRAFT_467306 [Aaosphaeria arxii CBS 175.79]|uniref:Cysteine-rich transmembrane CYSTM domain-containing protein n=1 Tax=Aaosphaeria arxii CBS 175.79 TaxID=1450172 RepID=A0A6A5XA47_9PLEO|nr:uncharacterized protein BU24DRAFT_467306 [Aaosphaeria arxii CBS 175.79]KAF2009790.1 hypothetical protein BU24DRAFT_467306 [Aaosphaeria arxii CBS 175.79]
MSANQYYNQGPPQYPQQSYSGPYGQPQYGGPPPQQQMYYPPQGQQMQYQQGPPPPQRQSKDRGCLAAW